MLIDVQRGHRAALEWFGGLAELPSVPGLVVIELIQGAQNMQQVRAASCLVVLLPMMWPTAADHGRALADFSNLHLSGGLGLIASIAGGLSAELCSFNGKHYRVVPGLVVVQPYVR